MSCIESKVAFLNQRLWIFLLSFLFLFETLLFCNYVLREIVTNYPTNHDQGYYLSVSYGLYERFLKGRWTEELLGALFSPQSTGLLFPIQAAIFFLFAGASRFSALLLNFIYYLLLQLFTFHTLRYFSKNWEFSFLGMAYFLSVSTTFFWAGGLTDFRIDFMVFCLYGIFIAAVLRSNLFLSRKYSLMAACIAIFLILMRFITAVYFAGIFFCLFGTFLIMFLRQKKTQDKKVQIARRIWNMLASCALMGAFTLPFFYISGNAIYGYYFIGHLIGPEKEIRAQEQGIYDWVASLLFYPRSVLFDHLGLDMLVVMGIGVLACFIPSILKRFVGKRPGNLPSFKEGIFFLVFSFAIPLLILTLNVSKSPVVGNIIVSPLVWLTIWVSLYFFLQLPLEKKAFQIGSRLLLIIILGFGCVKHLQYFGRHSDLFFQDNIGRVMTMYEDIGRFCEMVGWHSPAISADRIAPYLGAPQLSAIYYERKRVFLNAQTILGGSIFAISAQEAFQQARQSDIVISSEGPAGSLFYPFEQSMEAIRPQLRALLEEEFILLNEYDFDHKIFRVFVRPDFAISGLSGEWIPAEGIILQIPSIIASRTNEIILTGSSNFQWITPDLTISARILNLECAGHDIKTNFSVSGEKYTIRCYLPKGIETGHGLIRIHLSFSHYFIPRDLKINQDSRRLVIMGPKTKAVVIDKCQSQERKLLKSS